MKPRSPTSLDIRAPRRLHLKDVLSWPVQRSLFLMLADITALALSWQIARSLNQFFFTHSRAVGVVAVAVDSQSVVDYGRPDATAVCLCRIVWGTASDQELFAGGQASQPGLSGLAGADVFLRSQAGFAAIAVLLGLVEQCGADCAVATGQHCRIVYGGAIAIAPHCFPNCATATLKAPCRNPVSTGSCESHWGSFAQHSELANDLSSDFGLTSAPGAGGKYSHRRPRVRTVLEAATSGHRHAVDPQ